MPCPVPKHPLPTRPSVAVRPKQLPSSPKSSVVVAVRPKQPPSSPKSSVVVAVRPKLPKIGWLVRKGSHASGSLFYNSLECRHLSIRGKHETDTCDNSDSHCGLGIEQSTNQ